MATKKMILEVIACSPDDCRIAEAGGANRIELCSAIEMGGLTPSIGLAEASVQATSLPVMAMIRPRSGGFNYSEAEFQVMLTDVAAFRNVGVKGIVFGILTDKRQLDRERMTAMVEAARGIETVCHRAYDATSDPFSSLELLIELGITRLLTSGQAATASEGKMLIKELIERAEQRIQILPGSGLNASNLTGFLGFTGADQVHLTAFQAIEDPSMRGVPLAFNSRTALEAAYRGVSASHLADVVRTLQ